jgi:hypothetical protein
MKNDKNENKALSQTSVSGIAIEPPIIDIAELIKLHDDFVFNKFKEELKKIGIEIKGIDCFKELKEDLSQVNFYESINVFYKKEPLFIYPSFEMWLGNYCQKKV